MSVSVMDCYDQRISAPGPDGPLMKPPLRLPDIAEDYEPCGQSKDRATDTGHSSETARSPQERLAGWVRSLYWLFPAAVPSDVLVSIAWERNVRRTFWIVGIIAGAVLTYTTRYFINGDAINYIEMGEALRQGNWQGFVNLTASPGYAALLGLGQILLDTNRFNEIPLLKLVNLACMIAAMGACDYFLAALKRRYSRSRTGATAPLPWPLIMALVYAMFLFSVLNWVRPRLMAPEDQSLARPADPRRRVGHRPMAIPHRPARVREPRVARHVPHPVDRGAARSRRRRARSCAGAGAGRANAGRSASATLPNRPSAGRGKAMMPVQDSMGSASDRAPRAGRCIARPQVRFGIR